MSSHSDSELELDSWRVELEIALLEDADFFQIRKICGNRPVPNNSRADVWRLCLRPDVCYSQSMATFAEVFDLVNQNQLHSDCERIAHEVHIQISSTRGAPATLPSTDDQDSEDTENMDEFEDAVEPDSKEDPVSTDQKPTFAQLTGDFESVVTHFCQSYKLEYKPELGWLTILKTLYLVMKPVDRQDLYGCFSSFYHHFLPVSDNDVFQQVSAIFRLLLQYHEPKLCNFLDSLNLPPEVYASSWCVTLFSQAVPHEVLTSLWDIYFLAGDPLLIFFMVLIFMKNVKSDLLDENKEQPVKLSKSGEEVDKVKPAEPCRDDVLERLRNMPTHMQVDDLTTLFDLSQRFVASTPASFRTLCTRILFTNNADRLTSTQGDTGCYEDNGTLSNDLHASFGSALCLSISVQELLDAQEATVNVANANEKSRQSVESCALECCPSIRYLIVDSRPPEQYNAGHLSTAFFLDTSLMLADPPQFQSTVQTLLQSQRRALASGSPAAGEHIAILSSGRAEELATVNMVAAAFLRLSTPFVSVVQGGYSSLHGALDGNTGTLNRWLVNHNPGECLSCRQRLSAGGKQGQPVSAALGADQLIVDSETRPVTTAGHQNPAAAVLSRPSQQQPAGEAKRVDGFLSRVSGVLFNRAPAAAAVASTEDTRRLGTGKPTSQLHKVVNKSVSSDKEKAQPVVTKLQSTVAQAQNKKMAAYRNTSLVFTIDGDDDADDGDDDEVEEELVTTSPTATTTSTTHSATSKSSDSRSGQPASTKLAVPWSKWLTTVGSVVWATQRILDSPMGGDVPVRDEGLDSCQPGDLIDTTRWSSRPEVRGVFACRFVDSRGSLGESGLLVLVERHMLVTRVHHGLAVPNKLLASFGSVLSSAFQKDSKRHSSPTTTSREALGNSRRTSQVEVLRSVPLKLIRRITANRRLPECLTFHYDCGDRDPADRLLMAANHSAGLGNALKDRLYLPEAGEVFRIIKLTIYTAANDTQDSMSA